MTAPRPGESALEGYRAIAAYLTERLGVRISEDGAYRLGTRKTDPLPINGYRGRVWAFPSALEDWVARRARQAR